MAGGADGSQDALQCLRGAVQIGPTFSGVPAGGEPDLRSCRSLQFAQEGGGDAAAEYGEGWEKWERADSGGHCGGEEL